MGHQRRQLALIVKDHPVWPRRFASIEDTARLQDRKLVEWTGDGKLETLAIVKGMGVVVLSNRVPVLFIAESSVQGRRGGVGSVTDTGAAGAA